LAPHCDDVEIFVMQLEGKKEWKLYKPMVELSRDYTQDLLQEQIGEPILEVTLEPGDMLYFPRGVIHQAKTVGDSHSTHISVSTYQQNTWGDFMNHAVTQAIEKGLEEDVSIRSGLPINYLSMLGTGKNIGAYIEEEGEEKNGTSHSNLNEEKVKEFKESVKKQLAKLIDYIDVNKAADAMCSDFMASRLPPYGHVKPEDTEEDEEEEPVILLNDKIKIKYPEHMRVVYDDEEENEDQDDDEDYWEDMEEDEEKPAAAPGSAKKSPKKSPKKNTSADAEDEDDEDADVETTESHIRIVHSLGNDRFLHMGPGMYDEQFGDMKLHVSFAKAAVELLRTKDYVCVKDIQMEDEKDRLFLANALAEHKLIELQPAAEN